MVIDTFNYEEFMETEDYIYLNEFSEDDQKNIIKYNGCGNIIFHVETVYGNFDEIWLFNNTDKITVETKEILPIWPYDISPTKNLQVVDSDKIKNIQVVFEPYTQDMIENELNDIQKYLLDNPDDLSSFDQMYFNDFDKKSQKLFKKHYGRGLIVKKVYTRLGSTFEENWIFHSVDRNVLFSEIDDETVIYLYSNHLNNKYNYEYYPIHDILKCEYSFTLYLNQKDLILNGIFEEGDTYPSESLDGSIFDDAEKELIKKYKKEGLVYYEFKTINDEIIRDYYEIIEMDKHDVNKEIKKIEGVNGSISDEELENIKNFYDYYDLNVKPYKFNKRNHFTVKPKEVFGFGSWYYQETKEINN